ncbi:diacylglycerol/lipid kinase family protein [Streptomyces sp. DSM 15324]|uniref:diacylglycerol/lipid kinase family protein n=1 Tax=Streptomyces sp. DSM 15324 TaxID=1739111 RepID=UPI000749FE38|nr:diacylglycerol kinase family protein [Streptomyces sp. DSM 15324]KUO07387.1 diacylglycerol kinase [Streptomyces sp. DSM 15324]
MSGRRFALAPRWAARMAVTAGTGAIVVLLLFGGLDSLLLVLVGAAGLAVTAAGVWWALVHTGPVRVLAALLAMAAPAVVVVLYVVAGLLWVVLVSLALWVLAVFCGRVALAGAEAGPAEPRERPAVPPRRPYLIMNPRSGGGKVGRFRLREKAEALGAEVLVLDVTHQQDVAALARRAADAGADLLGVAGGDGTQALVAAVAAERDLPFMVISAGTRNHFALDLGLDRDDPSTCLDALTDGVELRIDLGFINDRVFVNNASFGAYAAVVQSPAYRDDKVHTTLQMLPDLLTHQYGPRLVVRAGPGATVEQPQAVLVSNNPYRTDDPAGLGRRDRLNSGHLGVLGVKVDSAAQAAGMLRGHRAPGLAQFTAQEVVVDADEDAIPVGVDGEALTLSTPVRCRIQPRALRVRVPRERPGVRPGRPPMDWRRVRRLALTTFRRAAGHGGDQRPRSPGTRPTGT